MKKGLYLRYLLLLLLLPKPLFAQLSTVDSLELELNKSTGINRVEILLKLSDLYLSRNPEQAFIDSRKAVSLATSLGDENWLGKSYRSLGVCYSDRRDHDSSKFCLDKALTFIPKDAMTYYFLGENEWLNGDYMSCTTYYKVGEKYAIENLDMKSLAIIYYSFSEYYRYNTEMDSAQYYISLSLKILERSNLYKDLAVAYNMQAEIYRNKGEYKRALDTYIKTAQIAYQVVDSNRIGYCFSRMGYIYYMQELYDDAEKYLLKSLEISRTVKNGSLELFILKTLTDMYSVLADVSKCKYYAALCIRIGKEQSDPTGEALAYSSLSNLFYRIHQNDSAMFYANKSYKIAQQNHDDLNMLNALLNKLPLEFESGNYSEVINLTKEGIRLAEMTQAMEQLKDIYKYRYYAYEKIGNKSQALDAFALYKMYEDSLQNTDVSIGVHKSQLEMNYQDKRLADTIVYIENVERSERKVLLANQRSESTIIIGAVVVLSLSAILLIIWLTSLKRKKLNRSLAKANEEKELLLKEIHHRVKNSLQMVSSLLSLQKTHSGKKSFDELIDESQVKIHNISIVHELLYQSTSFSKINLQQYIDQLTTHILKTFNQDKEIRVVKNIEPLEISLDQSVPLALVINEIITNSVKYAFKGKDEGIITMDCKKQDDIIEIRIADNGIGMNGDESDKSEGIGIKLIRGFVNQLRGELKYGNNNGCFFVFSFPDNQE